MAGSNWNGGAKAVLGFRLAMGLGLLLTLALNLPGHLTVDSVVALVEARTGVRQTWAPAVSSWLLGLFDRVWTGTGLYVAATSALLFLSLMSLPALRPRTSWLGAALGLLVIFTPQFMIYQGIVWRDVLFANLTVAGFILLAHAAGGGQGRLLQIAGALACLSLATLARQNGVVLLIAGAAVVSWNARAGGRRATLAWGMGFLAAAAGLTLGLNGLAQPPNPGTLRAGVPTLILQHYDVVGAKTYHPKLRMDAIRQAKPENAAVLEAQSAKIYTPARIDTLDLDPTFRRALWKMPDPVMHAQWRQVITDYPQAYLLHRANVFRWIVFTPDLEMCAPVAVGVTGPQGMLDQLRLEGGADPRDQTAAAYAASFYKTPVFSHLTYILLALVLIAMLLRRRSPQDVAMIGLLGGSLVFVASFAVIGVACDYRYLYLMDLAAITAALYAALDPPFGRRR